MKIKFIALFIGCCALICGCSSQPTNLQYYVLHSPEQYEAPSQLAKVEILKINSILVPEYLNQANLSMLTSSTKVHFSSRHLWAESFKSGFSNQLRHGLLKNGIQVSSKHSPFAESHTHEITIQIDEFIPTYRGVVVFNGQYWLSDTSKKLKTGHTQYFNFEMNLNEDGFTSSVSVMRALIDKLSIDITNNIVN